jgi:aspartate/glutamate racemase
LRQRIGFAEFTLPGRISRSDIYREIAEDGHDRMKAEDRVQAIVVAGTELPLLLRESGQNDIEFLDTTVIDVEAIVNELLAVSVGIGRLNVPS